MSMYRVWLIVLYGATVLSMDVSLSDKSFPEWIEAYKNKGKPIEEAITDYYRENPSFLTLLSYEGYEKVKKMAEVQHDFEHIAGEIKSLANKSRTWKKIVNGEHYTKCLLRIIEREKHGLSTFGYDRLICGEGIFLHEELATAILGTPGAIALGKKCIMIPENKDRLIDFLFNIVGHREIRQGKIVEDCFAWPDEDFDVAKAAIEMGIDLEQKRDGGTLLITAAARNKIKIVTFLLDRGADIENRSICEVSWIDGYSEEHGSNITKYNVPKYMQSYTALLEASRCGCKEMVDLLIARKANVNAIDHFGRTPLIVAALSGHVEIVKKLLAAKACVWLADGFNETALNHAQKHLSGKNKESYSTIIQLLKDVGQ